MAYCLEVLIIDAGDSTIKVGHCFYGYTEQEVQTYYREHLHSCSYFKAAHDQGRVIEELEEIDDEDLPDADEDEEDDYEAV
jgi:hypothetical protein